MIGPDHANFVRPISSTVRVTVRYDRQVEQFAVTLQVLRSNAWTTVRLIDNHRGQVHMHRYDGLTKLDPEAAPFGDLPPREAIPEAIRFMVDAHESIIEAWSTR